MFFRQSSAIAAILLVGTLLQAQCTNDQRSNKNAGILISDFTITGTHAISATDLSRITSAMIGSCYDEDSDEMGERVRALFQARGYFRAEVNSLSVKPRDPLGVPKPVTIEAEVSEGLQYKLGEVVFIDNHIFPADELRLQFPLKKGALMDRDKIATGLESLRKLYGSRGYMDLVVLPGTQFGSNETVNLTVTVEEGPQYHMGTLDIVAEKEPAARLRSAWTLSEGAPYDSTYIDEYLSTNRYLLPANFSRDSVQVFQNCPDALIQVRLIVDPKQVISHSEPKNVPCEDRK